MEKKKVLIVDDDNNMRSALRRILSLDGQYDIDEATDGFIVEQKIKDFKPDLIVLDVKMPGKFGHEVCLNLRNDPATKHIKVLAISAFSGKINEAIMTACGADYFFEKPFDNDRFKAKIEELLRGS